MNFEALKIYGPLLLSGVSTTISLALVSLVLAIVVGALGCWGRMSKISPIRNAIKFYTGVLRGIPDLVMIFLVYYGGQGILNEISKYVAWANIDISAFWAGVATLGFYNGSFLVEVFRAAYMTIPRGQLEAARTFGLSRWSMFRHVILVQLVVGALSGVNNVWQVLMKSTALVSVIGLYDLVGYADKAGKAIHQPFPFFMAVLVFYLLLTIFSSSGFAWLEKRTVKFRRRSASQNKFV